MDSIPIPRDIALGLVSDPERYLPVVKEIISRASHPESTQAGLSPELAQPHDDVLQNQLRSHTPTLGPESMSFSSTTNSNKRSTSRATKKEAEHNDGGSPPFFPFCYATDQNLSCAPFTHSMRLWKATRRRLESAPGGINCKRRFCGKACPCQMSVVNVVASRHAISDCLNFAGHARTECTAYMH